MSRLNPRNRMEAFSHQINDEAKALSVLALLNEEKAFDYTIAKLKRTIQLYESKRLKNKYLATVKETNNRNRNMREKFPHMAKDFPEIIP